MPNSTVFAVNFGMTRSWSAVVHNGMEVIEPSARGISSYVEFGKLAPRVCGKFTETVNAANSVYGIKRLLGRKFDDPIVQDAAKYSPMDIVRGEEGRPAVRVEYYGESRPVLLEEVVAMTMVELKERIEKVVGHPMTDVVLTVPQCFGDSQRRALRDAATIAGLNVVRLLNETTTAAITYSHRCEHNDREHVLVVDVGGGSVNVAVVEVTASPVNVKSTAGSCCLGAEEFDRTLTDYCLDELAQNNGIDVGKLGVRSRKRLQRQLKSQCVEARQTLYSSSTARIKLDINGAEVQLDVSREVFDAFNEANFDRIRALIKAAIHDAPTDGRFFNAVYLIGGGSRVIALEKAITSLLPGTRLVKTFYRDEAVIKGAAVFASHFGSDGAGFKVIDVLGRSVLLDANQLQEIFAPNVRFLANSLYLST
ncbi:heat shock protein 70 [Aphelenchoides avenae]|nr:heat shock protein 70 [Aphelenchus avenae]